MFSSWKRIGGTDRKEFGAVTTFDRENIRRWRDRSDIYPAVISTPRFSIPNVEDEELV